jgi:hypothetical protein
MHPRVVHADSHMWYPERKGEEPELFGVWASNINAILPDSIDHSDFAGDCYLRGLICRVAPVAAGEEEWRGEDLVALLEARSARVGE